MTAPRTYAASSCGLPYDDPDSGETVYPCNCCWWCGRCNKPAKGQYGHLTILCKVAGQVVGEHHFCCPGDCELGGEVA